MSAAAYDAPIRPQAEPEPGAAGNPFRRAVSIATLVVATALLAGTFLLLSPREGQTHPGAIPWSSGSVLKAIVDFMSLKGLGSPQTSRGVEIKDFVFHLATAAGLALLAIRAAVSGVWPRSSPTKQWTWLLGQAFMGGWVLLSLASASWSSDASLSLGQGILYALALGWAVSLAWTLEWREIARLLTAYIVTAAVGAALCVWYYYERNPAHRPGFPIGNPSTLAAAIAPAFVLVLWLGGIRVWEAIKAGKLSGTPTLALLLLAAIPLAWCLVLTSARSAALALLVAGATIALLQTRGQARAIVLAGCLFALAGGIWYINAGASDTEMARGASLRFRTYAWRYAAELWSYRAISGHGAGSYSRLATGLAAEDRHLDPAAFMAANVEHAHNELFEVLAEIGLIGGLTFVGGYVATAVAAVMLLASVRDPRRRLLLVGVCAGMAGLVADAMFGVGLRLPGVPAVHYTMLGILWAACVRKEEGDPIVSIPERERAGAPVLASHERHLSGSAEPAPSPKDTAAASPDTKPSPEDRDDNETPGFTESPEAVLRYSVAAGAGLAAVLAAWAGFWNWSGALAEQRAEAAMAREAFTECVEQARAAEAQLLDPFRRLVAAELALRGDFARAYVAIQTLQMAEQAEPPLAPQELAERRAAALERATEVFEGAQALEVRAPSFGRVTLFGARAAEMITQLVGPADRTLGQHWYQVAWTWYRERVRSRPTEIETLLSIYSYEVVPSNPSAALTALGLLRSGLREAAPSGLPPNEWFAALQQSTQIPGFDAAIGTLIEAAGPYTSQTDLDTLAISFAPETHRLVGYLHALQGDYTTAIRAMGIAGEMYERMRARFPELHSTALGEQADMLFMRDPSRSDEAILLARRGIEALPIIQEQKLEALQAGRRMRLAQYLLAAGREQEAVEELRKIRDDETRVRTAIATLYLDLAQRFLTMPPDQRPPVMAWVQASLSIGPKDERAWRMKAWLRAELGGPEALDETLAEARAAGLSEEELGFIQGFVVSSFAPPQTQPATQSASATATAPATATTQPAVERSSTPASALPTTLPAPAPNVPATQPATRPATVP